MSTPWHLVDRDTGTVVVDALEVADTFCSRFWGLQFRRRLPAGTGLLLVPCASVHTFWMRFAIDVVFLSGQGRVLEVRGGVRPWRIVGGVRAAHAVLEVAATTAAVTAGVWLQIEVPRGSHEVPPASLRFLC